LITSEARVHPVAAKPDVAVAADPEARSGLWLHVHASPATKCVRCWHKRADVGTVAAHPELCARCVSNVEGPGETRRFA